MTIIDVKESIRQIMSKARFYYKDKNAPMPNRPNHIGSTIIICYDGKVLLESRADSDRWAFIGGGLQLDENLKNCIIRETFEETGLVLEADKVSCIKIYDDPSIIIEYPDGNIIRSIMALYFVRISLVPQLVCSDESKELRFFDREELKKLPIVETHIPILEDIWSERIML
ncbi:MAG: NUDIX domain-containing protein [Lachnospiraceae bacterium]|nr:NUDIX domain-containing protein [Lachnospiraceae bacterium]